MRTPGGWWVTAATVKAVQEETGLAVRVGTLVHAELFEVVPGHRLMMVALTAELEDVTARSPLAPSHEHRDVRWFRLDALPEPLPAVYVEAIRRATG